MIIDGLQKLSLLDFPQCVSCIVFTRGCNFSCPFCQNSGLIECGGEKGFISEEEVMAYLNKRKGIIEGVVISGGEPLVQKNITNFIKKIRAMGLKVKLDTNGSNPKKLKELIDEGLLDYVAMDVKNVFSKYYETIGGATLLNHVKESISILQTSSVKHEFRTTIVKELHTITDMKHICEYIGRDSTYYLQNFEDSERVIDHSLHGFSKEELKTIRSYLKKDFPNMEIRALS